MTREDLRSFCLSLPSATEDIKWGADLCFLIAKKMFAVTMLEDSRDHFVSFKCTEERFAELIEMEGIRPAAYMARNHWVTVSAGDVVRDMELRGMIRESYRLVAAKLPKRLQAQLRDGKKPAVKSLEKKTKSKRSSS